METRDSRVAAIEGPGREGWRQAEPLRGSRAGSFGSLKRWLVLMLASLQPKLTDRWFQHGNLGFQDPQILLGLELLQDQEPTKRLSCCT